MAKKSIRINVMKRTGSDLLVAMSDDLKGLMVHGRTEAQLDERIPQAIRAILEAAGATVIDVQKVAQIEEVRPRFEHQGVVDYSAKLAA